MNGDRMAKQVYLTIDDGPSNDFRDKIDFLYERNIHAILFCIGENIKRYQEDVVYAISKGFLIGSHSYIHKHFSDLSIDEGKESIKMTDDIINETYKMAGIERPLKVFRFPHFDLGGDNSGDDYESKWSKPQSEWFLYPRDDRKKAFQEFLKELGYVQPLFKCVNSEYLDDKTMFDLVDVRCTFDQMEYFLGIDNAPYGMDKEEAILGRIDEDFPYAGRSLNCLNTSDIILIHDHEKTTELFYKIINKYIEKNFKFLKIV
jgi:peptidoglycan/xylan/chitin deacetylase (PgdA/CDA1 family)